jgi:proteasome lid subunit RPN8/RPN11
MYIFRYGIESFLKAMISASVECTSTKEEEGGIIMEKDAVYEFVRVKNVYEGTDRASGLYETDQEELSQLIFSRVCKGWKMHASFHTHPSFSPTPSSLDLDKLFQGFRYNIIWSPTHRTFSYSAWIGEESYLAYLPISTIEKLIK